MKQVFVVAALIFSGLFAFGQNPSKSSEKVSESANLEATAEAVAPMPQGKLPTQTEIVKFGSKKYFPNLKKNIWDNLKTLTGINEFPKYQKSFSKDPVNSPFSILNANALRNFPAREWSLPFYNSADDMADVLEVEFGMCAGFTVTLRKLNMMAFYDIENTQKQIIPEAGTPAWAEFYNKKIDDMMNNKMTIIPGFSNLYEMASVPPIQKHIKEVIVRQWELVNVNFLQGTLGGMLSVKKKPTIEELKALHVKLSQRVQYGYNPIVYLSKYNDKFLNGKGWKETIKGEYEAFKASHAEKRKTYEQAKKDLGGVVSNLKEKWSKDMTDQWIHVLMIYEVSPLEKDGSFFLKAWDINEQAEDAVKRVTVSSDAKITMNMDYTIEGDMIRLGDRTLQNTPQALKFLKSNASELNAIVPLKWDDLDVEHMIKANIEFCKTNNCAKK